MNKPREFTIYECPSCGKITMAIRCVHSMTHPTDERGHRTVPIRVVELPPANQEQD